MPKTALSEARIKALAPRKSAYDIRDAALKGFGVRVLPSGAKRFFVHAQHQGRRVWKTVGDADAVTVAEARSRATSLLAEIRPAANTTDSAQPTRFDLVAEAVFQRYVRVWKPHTHYVNRSYLRCHLLPTFSGRHVADITHQDVRLWFASLRTTPVAADRSLPVLSVILREAELLGYRPAGSNPCRGIRRYRRTERERFLTDDEIGRLATALSSYEAQRTLEVAAVRLLLLTGCRKSEILTLRWTDYRDGHLFLRDSKTGPKTVWLSSAARDVIDCIPRTRTWVFPLRQVNRPWSRAQLDRFWRRVRADAVLPDVRLHDLRHTYATFALRRGESVLAIGRLLGHSDPGTTLKYTHLADATIRKAIETVGVALEG